jgi:hypothetical protein
VQLMFSNDEEELQREFEGCAAHIAEIWKDMTHAA